MNSNARTTSISSIRPQAVRRPSVSSRLSFAVSTAEQGEGHVENGQGIAAQHQIEEEIAKIKRYEVGVALPVLSDGAR
jgi:chloride channel 3/4/5